MRAAVRDIAHATVRRILPPAEALSVPRLEPLSRDFGLERGTPIDRRYIEQFVAGSAKHIRGTSLEIASADYSKRYASQLERTEILHVSADAPGATIVGDLTRPETLPERAVDCFICTQTFQFIFDVHAAVRGAHRVLKPGGTLIATVAGISQISRYDMDNWGDYWRFTQKSARMLMEQVFAPEDVHIETYGNLFAVKTFLDGQAQEDLDAPSRAALEHRDPDYPLIIGIRATRRD